MNDGKIKVILADDNKDFCDVMNNYFLKHEDIEVIGMAYDGLDAYEKIKSLRPDVAIIDGIMPRLDGLGVLEKINKRDDPHAPVCIMLSAVYQERITQKAIDLGAEYYIVKPFDMDSLADRIRQLKSSKAFSSGKDTLIIKSGGMNSALGLESRVTNILHEIGVPAHIRGYHYMREAIMLAVNDNEVLNYITKELYPPLPKNAQQHQAE